jgi:thioesterase domain-containing protein
MNDAGGLASAVERLWLDRIPLAGALGVRIATIDDGGVELIAPLGPNVNHMGTGFAGSLLAVASLAGWATVAALLRGGSDAHIVVQGTNAEFLEPVTADLRMRGVRPEAGLCAQFMDAYARRGRARISIVSEAWQAGRVVMRADSRFVALRR